VLTGYYEDTRHFRREGGRGGDGERRRGGDGETERRRKGEKERGEREKGKERRRKGERREGGRCSRSPPLPLSLSPLAYSPVTPSLFCDSAIAS
jgi:hypothetical protein